MLENILEMFKDSERSVVTYLLAPGNILQVLPYRHYILVNELQI